MKYKTVTLPRYHWKGYTAVCIAGGASLTQEQVDMCKHLKVIAVNDAYKMAPWADILYACDNQWWRWHDFCPDFKGWKITHEQVKRHEAIQRGEIVRDPPDARLDVIVSDGCSVYGNDSDLCNNPLGHRQDRIKHGGNSGFQALAIALMLGADRVLLLGYDMHSNSGKSHWFGEHPNGKLNNGRYATWLKEFPALREFADLRGQEVVNCTPGSALDCFKKNNINNY